MTYKEFVRWCNERASDGCWGPDTYMLCLRFLDKKEMKLFAKEQGYKNLEALWQGLWNEDDSLIRRHIESCDNKRKELYGQ